MSSIPSRAAAWAVHAFTASGAVMGLAALQATAAGDYRAAFLWMIAATAVDGVDGWLARLARVSELAPSVDGARLDDIVDYLTYVFVPAFLVCAIGPAAGRTRAGRPPRRCCCRARTASAAPTPRPPIISSPGFRPTGTSSRSTSTCSDWAPAVNAAVLVVLAVLVFVPIGYVYPSRTVAWRLPTVVLGSIWAGLMTVIAWRLPGRAARRRLSRR